MTEGRSSFFRDNVFLIAAAALPLIVAGFFILTSTIPRLTVAPPAYDLLIRTDGGYDANAARMAVDYAVRDGRVEATVRPVPENTYMRPGSLFLFDHKTLAVSQIPVNLPRAIDAPQTMVVDALANRRVLSQTKAPDGYEFESRTRSGPGIVGEIFGMNRYEGRLTIVNKGRVVPLSLPAPYPSYYNAVAIGWLE